MCIYLLSIYLAPNIFLVQQGDPNEDASLLSRKSQYKEGSHTNRHIILRDIPRGLLEQILRITAQMRFE